MPVQRRIQPLSPQLANQIAAGEVVERPASVVKELLENSIDAGAERIDLELEQGGSKSIRVQDNGCGIHREDLSLAVSPHATSKIYSQKDLERISSLGFRGEALASIASVSRFTLCSHLRDEENGWQVSHDGKGGLSSLSPCALPPGTRVEVRDLFFNIPARRKFLRSERTEFLHVEEVVRRLALSRFDIAFTLTHNNRQVLRLRPSRDEAGQLRRVGEVLGKGFMQHAITLSFEAAGMRLHGWLTTPDYSRSQADSQYFYLNGRMVRDKLINHAVRQAYQTVLEAGRYPAFLLYLDVDPRQVDINVHPTKHEVRFRESRMVHDFIHRALLNALDSKGGNAIATEAPFESTTERGEDLLPRHSAPARGFTVKKQSPGPARVAEQMAFYRQAGARTASQSHSASKSGPLGKALALLHDQYLLASNADGPLLLDLHAARRRVITARFEQMLSDGEIQSRPLLIPLNLQMETTTIERLSTGFDQLLRLGFLIERLGPSELVVREVPLLVQGADVERLLHRLFEELQLSNKEKPVGDGHYIELLAQSVIETAPAPSLPEAEKILRELEGVPQQGEGLWRPLPASRLQQWLSGKD